MRLTVRKINIADSRMQELLSHLQKECLPYDEPFDTTAGHWWLAFAADGTALGFAGLVRTRRWADCGYLCRAGVVDAAQGFGLQKRLIRARIAYARRLGWSWLITDTYENPPSANSLISCGFKTYKPGWPWGADGVIYWRKKL